MYEELIREVRRNGLSNGTVLGRHIGIMDEAADAIEAQDAEIERLNAVNEVANVNLADWAIRYHLLQETSSNVEAENDRLYADIARVTAERDAAVALIEKVNGLAVGAIEYGPYQDGEEAKLFFEIETLTRTPAKQGEEETDHEH